MRTVLGITSRLVLSVLDRVAKKKVDEKLKSVGATKIPPTVVYTEKTTTYGGLPVSAFRLPARSSKVHLSPVKVRDINAILPQPVDDPNIVRIRHDQARKTAYKTEILTLINRKQEEREIRLKKMAEKKSRRVIVPRSFLPDRYARGELPCTIEHSTSGLYLSWACPLDNLDYEYYLPLFFDGLQCKEHPVSFVARQGVEDLLLASKGHPEWVIPCIANLATPIRNALAKYDPYVTLGVLKAMQQLLRCNVGIGEALLPFVKMFLIPVAKFIDMNKNIGDAMDYGQRKQDDVGAAVRATLELLEESCGPTALAVIKGAVMPHLPLISSLPPLAHP